MKLKNGENVPYLEITELVLIHCNVVNNSYQESRAWSIIKYLTQKFYIFENLLLKISIY